MSINLDQFGRQPLTEQASNLKNTGAAKKFVRPRLKNKVSQVSSLQNAADMTGASGEGGIAEQTAQKQASGTLPSHTRSLQQTEGTPEQFMAVWDTMNPKYGAPTSNYGKAATDQDRQAVRNYIESITGPNGKFDSGRFKALKTAMDTARANGQSPTVADLARAGVSPFTHEENLSMQGGAQNFNLTQVPGKLLGGVLQKGAQIVGSGFSEQDISDEEMANSDVGHFLQGVGELGGAMIPGNFAAQVAEGAGTAKSPEELVNSVVPVGLAKTVFDPNTNPGDRLAGALAIVMMGHGLARHAGGGDVADYANSIKGVTPEELSQHLGLTPEQSYSVVDTIKKATPEEIQAHIDRHQFTKGLQGQETPLKTEPFDQPVRLKGQFEGKETGNTNERLRPVSSETSQTTGSQESQGAGSLDRPQETGAQEVRGKGGSGQAEVPQPQETSLTHEDTDALRAAIPELSSYVKEGTTIEKVVEEARGHVESAVDLAKRTIDNPRPWSAKEQVGALIRAHELSIKVQEGQANLAKAIESGDVDTASKLLEEHNQNLADLDALTLGSDKAGSEAGLSLRMRQLRASGPIDATNVRDRAVMAKKAPLTEAESNRVAELEQKLKAANAAHQGAKDQLAKDIADRDARIAELEGQQKEGKAERAVRGSPRAANKEALKARNANLASQLKALTGSKGVTGPKTRGARAKITAQDLSVPLEQARIIKEIAINHAKMGLDTLGDVVDATIKYLKDNTGLDFTRQHVIDSLSLSESRSRSDVQKQIDDIRNEAKKNSTTAIMERGAKGPDAAEDRKVKSILKANKDKEFSTRKDAQAAYDEIERLKDSEAKKELQKWWQYQSDILEAKGQLKSGIFSGAKLKSDMQLSPELEALKKERDDYDQKVKDAKADSAQFQAHRIREQRARDDANSLIKKLEGQSDYEAHKFAYWVKSLLASPKNLKFSGAPYHSVLRHQAPLVLTGNWKPVLKSMESATVALKSGEAAGLDPVRQNKYYDLAKAVKLPGLEGHNNDLFIETKLGERLSGSKAYDIATRGKQAFGSSIARSRMEDFANLAAVYDATGTLTTDNAMRIRDIVSDSGGHGRLNTFGEQSATAFNHLASSIRLLSSRWRLLTGQTYGKAVFERGGERRLSNFDIKDPVTQRAVKDFVVASMALGTLTKLGIDKKVDVTGGVASMMRLFYKSANAAIAHMQGRKGTKEEPTNGKDTVLSFLANHASPQGTALLNSLQGKDSFTHEDTNALKEAGKMFVPLPVEALVESHNNPNATPVDAAQKEGWGQFGAHYRLPEKPKQSTGKGVPKLRLPKAAGPRIH